MSASVSLASVARPMSMASERDEKRVSPILCRQLGCCKGTFKCRVEAHLRYMVGGSSGSFQKACANT